MPASFSELLARKTLDGVLTVGATDYKAHCLALFDELVAGRLTRIRITRQGARVAETTLAPRDPKRPARFEDIWGCMAGTVTIAPGVDLTAPTFDEGWEEEMLRDWDEQNR